MRTRILPTLSGAALIGASFVAPLTADERHTERIDRCIESDCGNGTIRSVTVDRDRIVIIVFPDRCPRSSTPCRNRYDRIVAVDGRPVEVDGYVPGERTVDPFRIVAPADADAIRFEGIAGRDRAATFDLRPFREAAAGVVGSPDPSPPSRSPRPASEDAALRGRWTLPVARIDGEVRVSIPGATDPGRTVPDAIRGMVRAAGAGSGLAVVLVAPPGEVDGVAASLRGEDLADLDLLALVVVAADDLARYAAVPDERLEASAAAWGGAVILGSGGR